MHTRKEIRSLSPEELIALRRAMIELQRKEAEGSYIDLAGYHGIPRRLCPHGSPLFLTWHRAYIRIFEQALQKIDPTVTLPFWDWTSDESFAQGMANAHSDLEFNDGGTIFSNPLMAGPIEDRSRSTRRVPPHDLNRLRSFAQSVKIAMEQRSYLDFNNSIEGPHGSIHVWVGGSDGDMSTVPRAAYDPIFWSHHAMVDRQWALWQKCNPERNPTDEIMTQELSGFIGWTVADTIYLNSPRLDYTYEGLDMAVCPSGQQETDIFVQPDKAIRERNPRIIVEVREIDRDGESFMVDIFVSNTNSFGKTIFGGSFGIFGAEGLHGTHHHVLKTVQQVDITSAIKNLGLSSNELQSVELQLKAINKLGDIVDPASLPIGTIEIHAIP